MKGDFLIDGSSAYNAYGVFVQRGGYTGVLSMPSFKNIETVSWLEDDGIEADLSSPVLDKRSMNITFGFRDIDALPSFFDRLSEAHSHSFSFPDIGRSLALRMISNGSLSSLVRVGSLSLSFIEDVVALNAASPFSLGATEVTQRGFAIDGVDLSQYGCWVLDGFVPSWRKAPAVKENLVISSKTVAGQTYYGQSDGVQYKSKDFSLRLLIRTQSLSDFNRCYDALFYALTRPQARNLTLGSYAANLPCYYKSSRCSRMEVFKTASVWCELELTLTMLSVRPEN